MKKILILSANPMDTSRLRLDKEVREIQSALERSQSRDNFQLITKSAVRINDLRRAMLDSEPQIVHFSGHGIAGNNYDQTQENQPSGIVLESDSGEMQLVSTKALTSLFELFKDKVECILLNACYSESQAEAIYKYIDCVIGMNNAIPDNAAINFSIGFYDAIGACRSYADAFKFGCNNIDLNNIPGDLIPAINSRNHVKKLFDNNTTTKLMEQQPSQSISINGGTVSGQLGLAGRDLTQKQYNNQGLNKKQLAPADVVELIAKLESLFSTSDLPDASKKQALKHLDYAKDAVQDKEPDKNTAATSLKKAVGVLKDANEAFGAGQGIWKNLEPIAHQLAPWLGIAAKSLVLLP